MFSKANMVISADQNLTIVIDYNPDDQQWWCEVFEGETYLETTGHDTQEEAGNWANNRVEEYESEQEVA